MTRCYHVLDASVPTPMTGGEHIPRYPIPEQVSDKEPETGACWNCGHSVDVTICSKTHMLCVCNRDETGEGDVFLADPDMRGCGDWVDYEA